MNKANFFRFLPVREEINIGDFYFDNTKGHIVIYKKNDADVDISLIYKYKAKLFLCSSDIAIGSACYNVSCGIHDFDIGDPHFIMDLHNSIDKSVQIRTSHGYGPKEDYFRILYPISKDLIWWVPITSCFHYKKYNNLNEFFLLNRFF